MFIVSGDSEKCRRERHSPSVESHSHILIDLINPCRQVVVNFSNPPVELVEPVVDLITQGVEGVLRWGCVCHRVFAAGENK